MIVDYRDLLGSIQDAEKAMLYIMYRMVISLPTCPKVSLHWLEKADTLMDIHPQFFSNNLKKCLSYLKENILTENAENTTKLLHSFVFQTDRVSFNIYSLLDMDVCVNYLLLNDYEIELDSILDKMPNESFSTNVMVVYRLFGDQYISTAKSQMFTKIVISAEYQSLLDHSKYFTMDEFKLYKLFFSANAIVKCFSNIYDMPKVELLQLFKQKIIGLYLLITSLSEVRNLKWLVPMTLTDDELTKLLIVTFIESIYIENQYVGELEKSANMMVLNNIKHTIVDQYIDIDEIVVSEFETALFNVNKHINDLKLRQTNTLRGRYNVSNTGESRHVTKDDMETGMVLFHNQYANNKDYVPNSIFEKRFIKMKPVVNNHNIVDCIFEEFESKNDFNKFNESIKNIIDY